MNLDTIFNRLWNDYITQNPSAGEIHSLFLNEGESVVNDHIAFRTLDYPEINIDVLAQAFISNGYVAKGEYVFKTCRVVITNLLRNILIQTANYIMVL